MAPTATEYPSLHERNPLLINVALGRILKTPPVELWEIYDAVRNAYRTASGDLHC